MQALQKDMGEVVVMSIFERFSPVLLLPMTLPESAEQCQRLGRGRYDELLKTNPIYLTSRFSNESPSVWAMAHAHRPEGEGLTETQWLTRFGEERLVLLRTLCIWLDGKLDLYRQLWRCPKCSTLEYERDTVSWGGGRIVHSGEDFECGSGWDREGCNKCDFEHDFENH